jgi:methylamine--corrinoid protein Co-methyltransferase
MEEADFERKLVGPTIRRLVKEYDIQYTGDCFVNSDDDLADRVFQAGMDFACEVGMFNQSTSRRIPWTRAEIEEALENCRAEASLGQGEQAYTVVARRPEDTQRVSLVGGVVGIPYPEDLFVPLTLSFLKPGVFDAVDGGSLETAYGHPIKAGTGWEVLGAWREAELNLEALEIVGKPGTPLCAVELAPTALGGLAGVTWGGFRPFDRHHVATTSEFKTNNDLLATTTHIHNLGGFIGAYYNPIYGGHVGGAEGVAVAVAAGMILLNQVTVGHSFSTRPTHPFFGCDTTPEILWATSLGVQALARNTNLMLTTLAGPAGGPGTKNIVYENAAFALMSVSSGVSELLASHSAGGAVPRHGSGLDALICAELTQALPGLTRQEANDLVARLVPLYQPDFEKKPIGRPFEEVYDVENVEPTSEWQGIYDAVKDEMIGWGVPLK